MSNLIKILYIIGGTVFLGGVSFLTYNDRKIIKTQNEELLKREQKIEELQVDLQKRIRREESLKNYVTYLKEELMEKEQEMRGLRVIAGKEKHNNECLTFLQQSLDNYGIRSIAFVGFTNEEEFKKSLVSFLYKPVLENLRGKIKILLYELGNNKYLLVERESRALKKLMQENKLELSEIMAVSTCKEFCKILGVEAIVTATIGDFDNSEPIGKRCDDVRLTVLSKNAAVVWTGTFYHL